MQPDNRSDWTNVDRCWLARGPELFPFTARESEIAKLVAQGLLNKEIADCLTVSVRTVDIYRMDNKRRHKEE